MRRERPRRPPPGARDRPRKPPRHGSRRPGPVGQPRPPCGWSAGRRRRIPPRDRGTQPGRWRTATAERRDAGTAGRALPEADAVPDDAPAPVEQARAQRHRPTAAPRAAVLRRARSQRASCGREGRDSELCHAGGAAAPGGLGHHRVVAGLDLTAVLHENLAKARAAHGDEAPACLEPTRDSDVQGMPRPAAKAHAAKRAPAPRPVPTAGAELLRGPGQPRPGWCSGLTRRRRQARFLREAYALFVTPRSCSGGGTSRTSRRARRPGRRVPRRRACGAV